MLARSVIRGSKELCGSWNTSWTAVASGALPAVFQVTADGAAGDLFQPDDGAGQGAFPRAGLAQDAQDFPALQLQAHILRARCAGGVAARRSCAHPRG